MQDQYEDLRARVLALKSIANATQAMKDAQEVGLLVAVDTAQSLDSIAQSLYVIAGGQTLGGEAFAEVEPVPTPTDTDEQGSDDAEGATVAIGDDGAPELAEGMLIKIGDSADALRVKSLGESEGARYAVLSDGDELHSDVFRVWLSALDAAGWTVALEGGGND